MMCFARTDDIDLVIEMIESFRTEIGETHPESTRQVASERIADNALVFWETDGQPVSMAGFKGRTPNGIRIVLVYTPPALRGRGYASSLVAVLSQHLLDTGRKFCFLYTDLANPTSNKIYRDVGYEYVADSIRIHFC
jgi:predicted GNAT family acetyltransferase